MAMKKVLLYMILLQGVFVTQAQMPPADSLRSYTFTDLEPGVLLGVWVRKDCRYTTPGYDTIAYSDWSHPVGFMALGLDEVCDGADFTLSPNPAHGTVQATLPADA